MEHKVRLFFSSTAPQEYNEQYQQIQCLCDEYIPGHYEEFDVCDFEDDFYDEEGRLLLPQVRSSEYASFDLVTASPCGDRAMGDGRGGRGFALRHYLQVHTLKSEDNWERLGDFQALDALELAGELKTVLRVPSPADGAF